MDKQIGFYAALLAACMTSTAARAQSGCVTAGDWYSYCAPTNLDQHGGYGAGGCYPTGCGDADYAGHACGAPCAAPAPAPSCAWVVSAGVLYLDRLDGAHYTYSYDSLSENEQHLDQREAEFGLAPGFEVRLTQLDPCQQTGIELVYWQLFPSEETATTLGSSIPGNLNAILNYSQLNYNGVTADNYTDNAWAHQLRREYDAYSVEANYMHVMQGCCGCGPSVSWITGIRVFRLEELSQFASDPTDAMFDGEVDELYYDIDTSNTLIGGQLGAYFCQPVTCRASLIAGAKVGAYANIAEADSHIGGAAGTATINNGPFNGAAWQVSSENVDFAMTAELLLGGAYQFTPRWRLSADYRVIGVTGVALPTGQIYHDLRGINDVALLDTSGNLILHGGFLGLECVF